jgi:formylglycine-generating enzyme required for sulfatase activity
MRRPTGVFLWVRRLALAAIAILGGLGAANGQEARRFALVIGNGAYLHASALRNPANDASALAGMLQSLGFDVDLAIDVDKARMGALVAGLRRRTSGVGVALFFYAGHGFQIDGRNYVVPVDARVASEADVATEAWDVAALVGEMDRDADVKLILLDACRDNPFQGELRQSLGPAKASAMLAPGLAPIQPAGGVLVGLATDPGSVAFDGSGDNSPFTTALLRHLPSPGVEINAAMTRVRAEVFAETEERQRPWTTTSLLHDVYLAGMQTDALDPTVVAFHAAEAAGTHEAVQDFVDQHPDGALHDLAEAQLAAAGLPAGRPFDTAPPQAVGEAFRDCLDCPQMLTLPAGTFTMGTAFGPNWEKPQSRRTIARPFAMSRTEVTRREWRLCAEAGACRPLPGPGDEGPAAGLGWDDVHAYLVWLSQRTGRAYRLPSEAEWEYAAQGGDGLRYPTGPVLLPKAAFFGRDDGAPVRVASYQPNPFGLHDLAGNVWEWVADCGAQYDARMTGAQPVTATPCLRVLRGGSFRSSTDQLRSSNRFFIKQDSHRDDFGLRVAVDLEFGE